jgi:hypothetical protein
MHAGRIAVGVSALLAMVLVVIALAWLLQRRLIYLAEPGKVPAAATILPGGGDVAFETAVVRFVLDAGRRAGRADR